MKNESAVLPANDIRIPMQSVCFDAAGRRTCAEVRSPYHKRSRQYFRIHQPDIDYGAMHARLVKHLGIGNAISPEDFTRRAECILERIRRDPATANLAKGVHVPFMLPQAKFADIGQALDDVFLGAVEKSFRERCPSFEFVNHHKDGLRAKLSVAPGSRHDRLLQAMAEGPVVGCYFPCLTEYSVPAAIEQTASLPDHFLLAGGFDTCAAFVGAPDLLLRKDGYPPMLFMAALCGEKEGVAYHFEAYGYDLTFNRRPHLNKVAEYWASGLAVLG